LTEETIQQNMASFRKRSNTFGKRETKDTTVGIRNLLEEKQYLAKVLENKLKSAETRLKDMKNNLEESSKKDEILQELNNRLIEAESKIKGKRRSNISITTTITISTYSSCNQNCHQRRIFTSTRFHFSNME